MQVARCQGTFPFSKQITSPKQDSKLPAILHVSIANLNFIILFWQPSTSPTYVGVTHHSPKELNSAWLPLLWRGRVVWLLTSPISLITLVQIQPLATIETNWGMYLRIHAWRNLSNQVSLIQSCGVAVISPPCHGGDRGFKSHQDC